MVQEQILFYEFAGYRLDVVKRLLLSEEAPVDLPPKAFDTLLMLVENHGTILEKEVIIKRIWPDTFVEEGNLTYYISLVRKALGESPGEHKFIVTIPKRGYSFVADVSRIFENSYTLIGKAPELLESPPEDSAFPETFNAPPAASVSIAEGSSANLDESVGPIKSGVKKASFNGLRNPFAVMGVLGLLIAVGLFFAIKKATPSGPQIKTI